MVFVQMHSGKKSIMISLSMELTMKQVTVDLPEKKQKA